MIRIKNILRNIVTLLLFCLSSTTWASTVGPLNLAQAIIKVEKELGEIEKLVEDQSGGMMTLSAIVGMLPEVLKNPNNVEIGHVIQSLNIEPKKIDEFEKLFEFEEAEDIFDDINDNKEPLLKSYSYFIQFLNKLKEEKENELKKANINKNNRKILVALQLSQAPIVKSIFAQAHAFVLERKNRDNLLQYAKFYSLIEVQKFVKVSSSPLNNEQKNTLEELNKLKNLPTEELNEKLDYFLPDTSNNIVQGMLSNPLDLLGIVNGDIDTLMSDAEIGLMSAQEVWYGLQNELAELGHTIEKAKKEEKRTKKEEQGAMDFLLNLMLLGIGKLPTEKSVEAQINHYLALAKIELSESNINAATQDGQPKQGNEKEKDKEKEKEKLDDFSTFGLLLEGVQSRLDKVQKAVQEEKGYQEKMYEFLENDLAYWQKVFELVHKINQIRFYTNELNYKKKRTEELIKNLDLLEAYSTSNGFGVSDDYLNKLKQVVKEWKIYKAEKGNPEDIKLDLYEPGNYAYWEEKILVLNNKKPNITLYDPTEVADRLADLPSNSKVLEENLAATSPKHANYLPLKKMLEASRETLQYYLDYLAQKGLALDNHKAICEELKKDPQKCKTLCNQLENIKFKGRNLNLNFLGKKNNRSIRSGVVSLEKSIKNWITERKIFAQVPGIKEFRNEAANFSARRDERHIYLSKPENYHRWNDFVKRVIPPKKTPKTKIKFYLKKQDKKLTDDEMKGDNALKELPFYKGITIKISKKSPTKIILSHEKAKEDLVIEENKLMPTYSKIIDAEVKPYDRFGKKELLVLAQLRKTRRVVLLHLPLYDIKKHQYLNDTLIKTNQGGGVMGFMNRRLVNGSKVVSNVVSKGIQFAGKQFNKVMKRKDEQAPILQHKQNFLDGIHDEALDDNFSGIQYTPKIKGGAYTSIKIHSRDTVILRIKKGNNRHACLLYMGDKRPKEILFKNAHAIVVRGKEVITGHAGGIIKLWEYNPNYCAAMLKEEIKLPGTYQQATIREIILHPNAPNTLHMVASTFSGYNTGLRYNNVWSFDMKKKEVFEIHNQVDIATAEHPKISLTPNGKLHYECGGYTRTYDVEHAVELRKWKKNTFLITIITLCTTSLPLLAYSIYKYTKYVSALKLLKKAKNKAKIGKKKVKREKNPKSRIKISL